MTDVIRVIGNADEFWRLRITRLDTAGDVELEWRDDILYRTPPLEDSDTEERGEAEVWHVEAVRLDDSEIVARLATCQSQDEALELVDRIQEDLGGMTKSEFEAAYVDHAEQGDTGVE